MSAILQITLGTLLLLVCTIQHVFITAGIIRRLRHHVTNRKSATASSNFALTTIVLVMFLASHTLHLYIWAAALSALGALPDFQSSIYFSLVTYSTVGYGDVTLGEDFRIFGAMAAVTGILLFGVTTAFLVNFFSHMMREADAND